jgi:ADP-ribosylglycohydrolase
VTTTPDYRSRVRGCLLGGAIGDALGAPIEFSSLTEIRARSGSAGVTELLSALVTDDTQMTLFTVEGMIRASQRGDRSEVHLAYLRWLTTQQRSSPPPDVVGWLGREQWLYAQRAPGNACLSGLRSDRPGTLDHPVNPNSKGCGTVMRSAPFGLADDSPERCFQYAVEGAVLTHGHPTGYLAAGTFAAIVRFLVEGRSLRDAVSGALEILVGHDHHEETRAAVKAALAAGPASAEQVEQLGGGWVAEEALAIGLYCALAYPEPAGLRDALLLSVNHTGDSDSTGSICGNLLGTLHGNAALPQDWANQVEGRDTILKLADEFVDNSMA